MRKAVHLTSVHDVFDTRIFQKECLSLKEAGYSVSVVGPYSKSVIVNGVQIVPAACSKSRVMRMFVDAPRVVRQGLKIDADVYHLHDPELVIWARMFFSGETVYVFDMHEDLPLQIMNKGWIPRPLRQVASKIMEFYEKVLLKGVPVVFAETSYKHSRPWIDRHVDVLNFPKLNLLSDMTKSGPSTGCPRVGYIGAVSEERGSMRMVLALNDLADKGVKFEFECIGGGSKAHRADLIRLAGDCGRYQASFPGRLDPIVGWGKIAACQVGLAVLEPIPNYLKSYPTKMFEYMALGIPVVVSNFPLYLEIIEKWECGIAVDPLSTKEVAEAVGWLLENPDLAREMGKRGREAIVSDFNWEMESKRLMKFYAMLFKD